MSLAHQGRLAGDLLLKTLSQHKSIISIGTFSFSDGTKIKNPIKIENKNNFMQGRTKTKEESFPMQKNLFTAPESLHLSGTKT